MVEQYLFVCLRTIDIWYPSVEFRLLILHLDGTKWSEKYISNTANIMVSTSIRALLKSTGRKLSLSSTSSSKSNSQKNHKNSFRDDNVQPDDGMFIRLLQEG